MNDTCRLGRFGRIRNNSRWGFGLGSKALDKALPIGVETPNGGSSLKDKVVHLEEKVDLLTDLVKEALRK